MMTAPAIEYTILDFRPILRYCYLNSIPHGGVLEQDINPVKLPLYEEMEKLGLLSITTRMDNTRVFCVTRKGAVLLPPTDLYQCISSTARDWLIFKEQTNVRPIFHGPFFNRVK